MRVPSSLAALLTVTVLAAAPVAAQEARQFAADRVTGLRFFERAQLGPHELTPFGVVRDQRCADPRFCYRPEDMRISIILHERAIPREVVLRLGQPVAVPGGYYLLRDPGTRPRFRGALSLDEYALDIAFIPERRAR
ncbi:hypothetical protein [Erythrobacter sp.]|jgi:hypothetical protein|uniref:hypothetical protein n=1 Tax=Erythrobacter sp. TaxID=1042 RepID=UPI002EBE9797|nr:hypothetical protein [Erythrobacter sp.]